MNIIAEPGDVIHITTNDNKMLTGYLSSIFGINKENGVFDMELLISQTSSHKGENFGTATLPLSYVKDIKVLHEYNHSSDAKQSSLLNIDEIKKIMNNKNITPDDIAWLGHISKSTVSRFLNGKTNNVSLQTAIGIAKGLDVPLDWIIS